MVAIKNVVKKKKWEEIERLHLNVEKIIARKGVQSPDAICASRALDYKIYEYYQCNNKSLRWLDSFKLI